MDIHFPPNPEKCNDKTFVKTLKTLIFGEFSRKIGLLSTIIQKIRKKLMSTCQRKLPSDIWTEGQTDKQQSIHRTLHL